MGKNRKYRIKADMVEIFPELKVEGSKSVWDVVWTGYLKSDSNKKVGTVSFDGAPERGHLHIVVEPEKEYIDSKEMKTMLRALVDWAFNQKGAYEIEAETGHEDDSRIYLLQAAGFIFRNGTKEQDYYSVTKQATSWTGLYLFIGIIAGFGIGLILEMMVTGLLIGVFIGIAIGAALDHKETSEQKEVTGEKSLTKRRLSPWGTKKSTTKTVEAPAEDESNLGE